MRQKEDLLLDLGHLSLNGTVGGNFAVAMAAYIAIVLGTATFNAIFVQILAIPLAKVLKR